MFDKRFDASHTFDTNICTEVVIIYVLLQVTEQSALIPFHHVIATVNVTVKDISEEAVDKSGSIRFLNITAERFITPEIDVSTKD